MGLATRRSCQKKRLDIPRIFTCWPRSRQLGCSGSSSDRFRHCPSRVSRLSYYLAAREADFLGILPQRAFLVVASGAGNSYGKRVKRVPKNRHPKSGIGTGGEIRESSPLLSFFVRSGVEVILVGKPDDRHRTEVFLDISKHHGLIPMQVAAFGQDTSRLPRSTLFRKKVAGTNLG